MLIQRVRPASSVHALSTGFVAALPHMFSQTEMDSLLAQKTFKEHHDDTGHISREKPLDLSWVADRIWPHVRLLDLRPDRPHRVDECMKLFRLTAGAGVVPPHCDEDYEGPDGSVAKYSILIYLNDGFTGGETVFNGIDFAPHAFAGSGLLFKHDIVHEGLIVRSGVKYVLKTDLFVR